MSGRRPPISPDAAAPAVDDLLCAAHARFEERVMEAMRAADPVAAVRAIAEDPALPQELRQAALHADARGIRMTALLVARLRFERLMQGSPEAGQWFTRDPASFAAAFRRYHRAVAPTAFYPTGEARLFAAWLAGQALAASQTSMPEP